MVALHSIKRRKLSPNIGSDFTVHSGQGEDCHHQQSASAIITTDRRSLFFRFAGLCSLETLVRPPSLSICPITSSHQQFAYTLFLVYVIVNDILPSILCWAPD